LALSEQEIWTFGSNFCRRILDAGFGEKAATGGYWGQKGRWLDLRIKLALIWNQDNPKGAT